MEADRLVTERLASLTELTDSLAGQAEEIGRQSDRLLTTLAEVRDQVGSGGEGGRLGRPQPAGGPSRGPHLSAVAPVGEDFSEISEPPRTAAHGGSAGARLLATQMAVSGSSREEIESRLRGGFEIEDAGSILDAILGPED